MNRENVAKDRDVKVPEEVSLNIERLVQLQTTGVVQVAVDPNSKGTDPESPFDVVREKMMPVEQAVKIELFVEQYVKDYDAVRAMQRMGYMRDRAIRESVTLLEDPYTQKLIDSVICNFDVDKMVTESQVMAGLLREANFMGEGATSNTRIKAWETIGKLKGMFVEKKEVNVAGSGVMEIPFAATEDEWEMRSVNQQTKLREDVRS